MKCLAVFLALLAPALGGCVLLEAGAAAYGLGRHHDWCREHTGNPDCYRDSYRGRHHRMPIDFR